jgi:tetratricopeptide (TPR) repeat protein
LIVEDLNSKRAASEIFPYLKTDHPIIFFVGAFVSCKSPTKIPMANELKEAIFKGVLQKGNISETRRKLKKKLNINSKFFRVRFGVVPLEQIIYDLHTVSDLTPGQLLNFLTSVPPNANHYILASLMDRELIGIVTTNFDELIERCSSKAADTMLYKPHGTISRGDELVARISDVGKQLVNRNVGGELRRILNNSTVCFVGYSGRDIDIRPILSKVPFHKIFWIVRPRCSGENISDLENEFRHLTHLGDKETYIRFISVDADSFLMQLGRLVGIIPPRLFACTPSIDWKTSLRDVFNNLSRKQALSFIARVFRSCGVWQGVLIVTDELLKAVRRKEKPLYNLWQAEAYYFLGEYRIAETLARDAAKGFENDPVWKARAYNILGNIATRSLSPKRRAWAERYYNMAQIQLLGNPIEMSLITSANAHLNLALFYKNRGKFGKADDELKQGISKAGKIGALLEMVKLEETQGILTRWQVREALRQHDSKAASLFFRKGERHFQRAAELASSLGAITEYGRVINNHANLVMEFAHIKSRLSKSKELLKEAIALEVGSTNIIHEVAKRKASMAQLLQYEKKWSDALSVWQEVRPNLIDAIQIGVCFREMAICYYMLGKRCLAENYIAKAIAALPAGPEYTNAVMVKHKIADETLLGERGDS